MPELRDGLSQTFAKIRTTAQEAKAKATTKAGEIKVGFIKKLSETPPPIQTNYGAEIERKIDALRGKDDQETNEELAKVRKTIAQGSKKKPKSVRSQLDAYADKVIATAHAKLGQARQAKDSMSHPLKELSRTAAQKTAQELEKAKKALQTAASSTRTQAAQKIAEAKSTITQKTTPLPEVQVPPITKIKVRTEDGEKAERFTIPTPVEENGVKKLVPAKPSDETNIKTARPTDLIGQIEYNQRLALGGKITVDSQDVETEGVAGTFAKAFRVKQGSISHIRSLEEDASVQSRLLGITPNRKRDYDALATIKFLLDKDKKHALDHPRLKQALKTLPQLANHSQTAQSLLQAVDNITLQMEGDPRHFPYFSDYLKIKLGSNRADGRHRLGSEDIRWNYAEQSQKVASSLSMSPEEMGLEDLTELECFEQRQLIEKVQKYMEKRSQKARAVIFQATRENAVSEEKAKDIKEFLSPQYMWADPEVPHELREVLLVMISRNPTDQEILQKVYPDEKTREQSRKTIAQNKIHPKHKWMEKLVQTLEGSGEGIQYTT